MKYTNIIKRLFAVLMCCLSQRTNAQSLLSDRSGSEMFYLEWQHMPLDSVMPRYTEVIPLESDYRTYDYKVAILFPEWKEMTKVEATKMQQWADSVSGDLRIHSRVGVMRGDGLLDVDFVPVVFRDGKYLKLMSAKMEITAVAKVPLQSRQVARKATAASERYTRTSKLNEGKWIKISIKDDGMYRLTRSALQKMGFKKPENVHLYGYGGHRLSEVSNPEKEYDDLVEVPLYQSDKDTWLFWGNGLLYWNGNTRVFNQYANAACYFLTEEDVPSAIETIDCKVAEGISSSTSVVSTFTDHVLYEKDEYAWAQIGRNLYESTNYAQSNSHTYKLTLPSESKGDEQLTIAFAANDKSVTTLTPTVNGTALGNMSMNAVGSYQAAVGSTKTYNVSQYKTGTDWTIKLTSTASHEARLDYLAMHFTRFITPGQSFLAFSSASAKQAVYQVMSDDCKVMRIGEPGSPAVMVEGTAENGSYYFSAEDASRRFVCFNPNYAFPQPTVVGEVSNQNLHALESLDMVIIIPQSGKLAAQAERLAEAHRAYDGLKVGVVKADAIYNEFSSGTPDATAYRRLMKMLYDRADGDKSLMPRYLILMGNCAFDNRMLSSSWRSTKPEDYLLCYESENSFSDTQSYIMEDYFGLLDDGEGSTLTRDKTDLGIGRFPVSNAAEAKIMVDKAITFISNQNAGAWKNVVMMMGDDGDDNSHMKYCDDVAELIIEKNPELEVKKVMWDAYNRVSSLTTNTYTEVTALMKAQLNEGVMMMNYTGHGASYVLSHEAVWHTEDYQAFKSSMLPLWFTAACDIMPFDSPSLNQGVAAVLNEGGGALAFVGTTRTVYASNNWRLNRYFSQYVFGKDADGKRLRLGDALRMTKVSLVGTESSNLENKLQYCLLGDPALVIGAPLNRVQLDAFTNTKTGQSTDVLMAGMPVKLEGHLMDAEGNAITDFNGLVTVRIYDSMDTIVCKRNNPEIDKAFQFTDRSSVLYTGQDSVRNGQFSLSFVVPKDIKYSGGEGRIVFYAINDALDTEANGYSEQFTIGGSVDVDDTTGPAIEMALNGEYGGTVNQTPYFTARLSDESGINATGNGVGHDLQLSIDDNPAWTYVLNDYYVADFGNYKEGSVGFTIPALPEGKHTLTMRAWDVLNNTNMAQMDFNVDLSYKPSILHLAASPNPAATSTTFLLTYDLPGTDCQYMIEVFDFAGRRLWLHQGTGSSSTGLFSIPWNLSVGNGYGRISPGVYLYRATISTGESKQVTKTQKLIVNW